MNFFTCDTCLKYNKWIDSYLIPQLKTLYQINLVRIPTQALLAVQLVENQVAGVAGAKNISVDLIWINLEVRIVSLLSFRYSHVDLPTYVI